MLQPIDSPYLVPFDGSFRVDSVAQDKPPRAPGEDALEDALRERVERLGDLQERLYAANSYAVLLVFQAMDAAGKDGTIRALLTGVNPAGCQVSSFKAPSAEELDHDFLWRTARKLPERGRIGVFNRSYYEEVLVVRVHPELLEAQNLPGPPDLETLWRDRYEAIRSHEAHLARSGVLVLKFWLNVSRDEQKRRFLSRIDEPDKNWKFSGRDVEERQHWDAYMEAYEQALNETSRPGAPWFAIPADDKDWMRLQVADIVVRSLEAVDPQPPALPDDELARLGEYRARLVGEP
ncbi:MAG: polyphosphate kinase 2 family protein [Deltaproteobacteria bacterium]|nr:polyphosphate kinase 2 family protein [Deltaproteobacteria bacterium]MCB9786204.1 polyphosphate kinase 2 family protein [Deltaproteobacteria bacterium]